MSRRAVALAALAAALPLTACGEDDRPLRSACATGDAQSIIRALATAPGAVRLRGGTSLSNCVERARSDADIQTVGILFTRAADALATDLRKSDRAALEVGYLIGAVRKGARHTSGIHNELVRRVEQTIGLEGVQAARRAAFDRGLAAGGRSG